MPEIDPYELARETDALDVEPDDDSTKVLDLIPEGLDRAGSMRYADPGDEAWLNEKPSGEDE